MTIVPIILLVVALVALALFVFTGLFVGMGYVISWIFPLSLFQACVLSIGTAFVVGFIFLGISMYALLSGASRSSVFDDDDGFEDDDFDEEDDYGEDEEEWEELVPHIVRPAKTTPSEKVSRNAPCPCGSGKKYKYCCGKQSPT